MGVFLLHTDHVVRWTLRQRPSKQAEPNATNIFCSAVYGSKIQTRSVLVTSLGYASLHPLFPLDLYTVGSHVHRWGCGGGGGGAVVCSSLELSDHSSIISLMFLSWNHCCAATELISNMPDIHISIGGRPVGAVGVVGEVTLTAID